MKHKHNSYPPLIKKKQFCRGPRWYKKSTVIAFTRRYEHDSRDSAPCHASITNQLHGKKSFRPELKPLSHTSLPRNSRH